VIYANSGTSVTLIVDGKIRKVSSFAGSVGGLLDSQGIRVGSRDLVAPAADQPLRNGDRIVVRYARPLDLTVDGTRRTVWTTELTVDAALRDLGIRADRATLSVSRSQVLGRAGLAVDLTTSSTVHLILQGRPITVVTAARTVSTLLAEQGVLVDRNDVVSLPGSAPVVDGMTVRVTRVDIDWATVSEPVQFATRTSKSGKLALGTKRVTAPGRAGAREAVYEVVLQDGVQTSRVLVSARLVTPPVDRQVLVGSAAPQQDRTDRVTTRSASVDNGSADGSADSGGTGKSSGSTATDGSTENNGSSENNGSTQKRKKTHSGHGTDSGSGLNWDALAHCESGGNSHSVSPNGKYYGLYQFSPQTWRSVGGKGLPSSASPEEQTERAKRLFARGGHSSWPVCGKRLYR